MNILFERLTHILKLHFLTDARHINETQRPLQTARGQKGIWKELLYLCAQTHLFSSRRWAGGQGEKFAQPDVACPSRSGFYWNVCMHIQAHRKKERKKRVTHCKTWLTNTVKALKQIKGTPLTIRPYSLKLQVDSWLNTDYNEVPGTFFPELQ